MVIRGIKVFPQEEKHLVMCQGVQHYAVMSEVAGVPDELQKELKTWQCIDRTDGALQE
jgi:hypothetical protein